MWIFFLSLKNKQTYISCVGEVFVWGHVLGGQTVTCTRWFSGSNTWVQGIELRILVNKLVINMFIY